MTCTAVPQLQSVYAIRTQVISKVYLFRWAQNRERCPVRNKSMFQWHVKDKMQLWEDMEVLGMVLKTVVRFPRFLVYFVSIAQPKPNSPKNSQRAKLVDILLPLKWSTVFEINTTLDVALVFLFSTDQDKRNVTQLWLFLVRNTHKFLYIPLFWMQSILNYLIS